MPLLFGLMTTDPTIDLYDCLQKIRAAGFAGIVNFPTVALIDGKFREALEEEGTTFDREVAAIKLANHFDLFTMAFVTNEHETRQMLAAGADVICVHLGLTRGGFLGAKKYISIDDAQKSATFDRIPIERGVFDTVKTFKRGSDDAAQAVGSSEKISVDFLLDYVAEHYRDKISFAALADGANISRTYLSARFKEDVGVAFSDYLLSFRLNKAKELLLRDENISCKEAALRVGYSISSSDYRKNFSCVQVTNPT
ncbi:MAG: phosphoenolpyruvate hydrolase family protein [Quinella sp. 1Q7]|nr:phosphoenolpyruvate hydrolase family protein [Quinella sp. 1Q7]